MDGKKLVKMANDIAAFFAAEPEPKVALEGIAGHIKKFWAPRMRRELLALLDAGGDGMAPAVREALAAHRRLLQPATR
ncbi:MAG: formate dehydrogenase subunit delta [Planctomycetes bacterium]|nr:formate dehydrogenase subunit delta [Planctomycetota bacterium]